MQDKERKFYINLFLGTTLSAFACFAAYTFSRVVFEGNNYIASVNGRTITVNDFKDRMNNAKKQYSTQMGIDFKTNNGLRTYQDLKKQVMQELVLTRIMLQNAAQENIVVTDQMVKDEISKIKATSFQNNQFEFEKALKRNNLTEDDLGKMLKEKLTFQNYTDKLFRDNIKISDKDLKDAYESKKSEFSTKEQVEASHILVKTEAEANDILKQLKDGKSFEDLAKQHSLDPGSKGNGGKLGFFGRGMMVPEFENAAFALKTGEISKPVKTNFGFHIIKKTGEKKASVASFDEVKENLKDQLRAEKQKAFFTEWKDKMMKEADIKYNPTYQDYSIAEIKAETTTTKSPQSGSETQSDAANANPGNETAKSTGSSNTSQSTGKTEENK